MQCFPPDTAPPTAIPTGQWTAEWLSNFSATAFAIQKTENERTAAWLIKNKISLIGVRRGESSADYLRGPSLQERLSTVDDVIVGVVEDQRFDRAVMAPYDFEFPFVISRLRRADGSTVEVAQGSGFECYGGYVQLLSRDTLLGPGVPYAVAVDRDASVHGVPEVVRGYSYFDYEDRLVPSGESFTDSALLGGPVSALQQMVDDPDGASARLQEVASPELRARRDTEYAAVATKIVEDFATHQTSAELLDHGIGPRLSERVSVDRAAELADAVVSGEVVQQVVQYCDASNATFCTVSSVQEAVGMSTVRHEIGVFHHDEDPAIVETSGCMLPNVGDRVAILVTHDGTGVSAAIPFQSYIEGQNGHLYGCWGVLPPAEITLEDLTSRVRSAHT